LSVDCGFAQIHHGSLQRSPKLLAGSAAVSPLKGARGVRRRKGREGRKKKQRVKEGSRPTSINVSTLLARTGQWAPEIFFLRRM